MILFFIRWDRRVHRERVLHFILLFYYFINFSLPLLILSEYFKFKKLNTQFYYFMKYIFHFHLSYSNNCNRNIRGNSFPIVLQYRTSNSILNFKLCFTKKIIKNSQIFRDVYQTVISQQMKLLDWKNLKRKVQLYL